MLIIDTPLASSYLPVVMLHAHTMELCLANGVIDRRLS